VRSFPFRRKEVFFPFFKKKVAFSFAKKGRSRDEK